MTYQYNLQFEQLCNALNLGEIIRSPEVISGGLLHRMYSIETSKGKFAIKALNPQIMARGTALNNYIRSEHIAHIASNHIAAQPANIYDDKCIQKLEGQYYLIFDWIDGISVQPHEVNMKHCNIIGGILADLHRSYFQIDNTNISDLVEQETDWNLYLTKGQETNAAWAGQLLDNIELLVTWSNKVNSASQILATDQVISHRDLEPKNVIWTQDSPVIIDWESAGFIHPMHDLIETAMYWSVHQDGGIDRERFLAFIRAYQQRIGILQIDWRKVLEYGFSSKLDWLEYSLKRSLWIECSDEQEQQMGTAQVTETLNSLRHYDLMIADIVTWLNNGIEEEE